MKYLLLLLLPFITKVYSINQNIIVLPKKKGIFAHIKIKDSFINFNSTSTELGFLNGSMIYYEEYIFEGGKNLTNISYKNAPVTSLNIDRNNNIFTLVFLNPLDNEYMNSITKLLNTLGYIDNEFYLEDKEKNKFYFGGIPKNINENYNSFLLQGLTYINFKMEIKFDNRIIYETNYERHKIGFNPNNKYMICFTPNIFNLFKKSILKIYDDEFSTYFHDKNNFGEVKRPNRNLTNNKLNTYKFTKEMKNLFPNFTIILGNKALNLNKYNIFKDDHDNIYTDLLISSSSCWTIKFGKYFFELFDYSEYDKDTEIVKMYLERNNSVFQEIEENIDNIKYIKTSKFDILILCSIIFMVTLFDILIINKRKNIKYFNNYYEINIY